VAKIHEDVGFHAVQSGAKLIDDDKVGGASASELAAMLAHSLAVDGGDDLYARLLADGPQDLGPHPSRSADDGNSNHSSFTHISFQFV
jgi:hypothetical protein